MKQRLLKSIIALVISICNEYKNKGLILAPEGVSTKSSKSNTKISATAIYLLGLPLIKFDDGTLNMVTLFVIFASLLYKNT